MRVNQFLLRKYGANVLLAICLSVVTVLYGCEKNSHPPEIDPPEIDPKEVNVLDFRQATSGDHQMIQRAIDYAVEKNIDLVWVPKGVYMIDAAGVNGEKGLRLRSGITLKLHEEAVLKAMPNNVANYSILRVYDSANVKITGGSILGEKNEHTGTGGEWGMGIDIQSSNNIEISNVKVKDCWGDGIYIGGSRISTNIVVDNVLCEGNRRQGISIVFADNVIIQNSTMSKTHGTAPQAGIDIEPNVGQYASNIKILDTKFLNNTGPGLFIFAGTGKVDKVIVRDCISEGNSHAGINLNGGNEVLPIKNLTNVHISNVTLRNNPLIGLSVKEVDGLVVDTIQIVDSKQRAVRLRFSKNISLDSIEISDVKDEAYFIEEVETVKIRRSNSQGLSPTSIGWHILSSSKVDIQTSIVKGGAYGLNGIDVEELSVDNITFFDQTESGLQTNNVSNSVVSNSIFENIGKMPLNILSSNNNIFKNNLLKNSSYTENNKYAQIMVSSNSRGNSISENEALSSSHTNRAKHVIWFDNSTSENITRDNTFEIGSYITSAVQDDTNGANLIN